jgi:hypothetical protein
MSDNTNGAGLVINLAGVELALAFNDAVAPMDLSAIQGAQANDDGSATLALKVPTTLTFVTAGVSQTASYESLTFRRLTGAELLKLVKRSDLRAAGMALSLGLPEARLALLSDKMTAPDLTAARVVFDQIMGGMDAGLPDHARVTEDGIELPLRLPAVDGDGEQHHTLVFRDLVGADLKAIERAGDQMLPTRLSRCTGLKLKSASVLFAAMDAADAYDANRVARFLSEVGRPTGG